MRLAFWPVGAPIQHLTLGANRLRSEGASNNLGELNQLNGRGRERRSGQVASSLATFVRPDAAEFMSDVSIAIEALHDESQYRPEMKVTLETIDVLPGEFADDSESRGEAKGPKPDEHCGRINVAWDNRGTTS